MFSAVLIVATLLAAQADAPAGSEELFAKLRPLVRQLDSQQLTDRDAAEKAIVELGPAVLDILPAASPRMSAETRQRLERIRSTLVSQAVEAATKATKINLHAEAMPLSEVLAELAKQSGNQIHDKRGEFGQIVTDPKLKVDFTDTPFWIAFDNVLDQAKLTTYNYTGEKGTLAVIARGPDVVARSDRASTGGVFRFEGIQVEAVRDLRNPENAGLKLFLEIAWEPRLVPMVVTLPLEKFVAVDENGDPLPIDGSAGTIEAEVDPSIPAVEMDIPLTLPPRGVEKIATLAGSLNVLVPGRVEKFTFDNLKTARDVEQKKAGATVLLQSVRKNGNLYEVNMILKFDEAANALESHRGWVFNNEAYLVDKEGVRVEHLGYETTRQTPSEVGFAYKFLPDNDLTDYEFVYQTPAAIVKKNVDFELKDLPLP